MTATSPTSQQEIARPRPVKTSSFIGTFDFRAYAERLIGGDSTVSQVADSECWNPVRIVRSRLNDSIRKSFVCQIAFQG